MIEAFEGYHKLNTKRTRIVQKEGIDLQGKHAESCVKLRLPYPLMGSTFVLCLGIAFNPKKQFESQKVKVHTVS
ncbi:hypothetical protein EGT74_09710 [Chitinophaga lutea]|uniref:Uncharacterized protein n=1 Tax=Chitinophaga lutea TaxID=2488634 RepID=A0A3N4QCS3_9BACT|nr:hypothetical protein EGT74_09710 [Chitinophaga lutea]